MTPTKRTFTATATIDGADYTDTRTSARPYTHAAFHASSSYHVERGGRPYFATFHSSADLAWKSGKDVANGATVAVVEVTTVEKKPRTKKTSTPAAPVEAPAPVEVEQPGTVATKTTSTKPSSKKKTSTKTTSTPVEPSTDLPAPGTGHLIGYARVSTKDQDAQLQRDALNAAGCVKIFEDTASGSKSADQRPQLAAILEYVRPGDTVCVWKIDRLSRSLIDLVTIVKGLAARGVKFRELNGFGEIDPNSPQGALMLGVLGSVAEFERAIIRQRTVAGLEVARAEGRVGGRPSVIDEDKLAIARARREKGESVASIAKGLGVSRATLYNHLGAAE